MHQYRTHNCSVLRTADVGTQVKLSGWVHRKRDHGELLFIDLRDHYGITQCVVDTEHASFDEITRIRYESVVTIVGEVANRPDDTLNPNLPTGEIEVRIESIIVESEAATLPFPVHSDTDCAEDIRLKHRFLDLRREKMHNNMILRSKIIASMRKHMVEQDFLEIQTPILTASSPEGARDFLVPSRMHPGKFYALPQAPQQFKQLLMVSGFDKYFQIAPCFRDEDARADRSPGEFYQLDMEMAFATQDDVFEAIEPVMHAVFTEFSDKKVTDTPFPRIPYKEAMLKYGSDKPDLRNPLIIKDATEVWRDSGFGIFNGIIKAGGTIRAIPAPKTAGKPRSFFDKKISFAQSVGAKGLAYIIIDEDGKAKGAIAKFLSPEKIEELKQTAGLTAGDSVFFSSGSEGEAARIAGEVRKHLGEELELLEDGVFKFCWIVDFPYYEYNEDSKQIEFSHNPFSMPQGGLEALETQEPLDILAYQYDIVCNGIELSSGAIRNHSPELMIKAFKIAGYDADVVEQEFGGMLNAFKFGAPPHGGIAPGVDRIVMLLAEEPNLREIVAFPMNQKAEDLLMNAPSVVDEKQLRELNISLNHKAKQALEKENAEG